MKDFFLREKNLLTIFYISYLHFFTSTIKTFCPEHFRKKIIKQDFILNFFKLYISNFSKKNMQYEEYDAQDSAQHGAAYIYRKADLEGLFRQRRGERIVEPAELLPEEPFA